MGCGVQGRRLVTSALGPIPAVRRLGLPRRQVSDFEHEFSVRSLSHDRRVHRSRRSRQIEDGALGGYIVERLVQAAEDAPFSDDRGDAVAAHVGEEVGAGAPDDD